MFDTLNHKEMTMGKKDKKEKKSKKDNTVISEDVGAETVTHTPPKKVKPKSGKKGGKKKKSGKKKAAETQPDNTVELDAV